MVGNNDPKAKLMLSMYPATSKWEFSLQNGDKVNGEVYCTDPISGLVVLVDRGDIRLVTAGSIQESKLIEKASAPTIQLRGNMMHTKKALEEREKRGVRLAQER